MDKRFASHADGIAHLMQALPCDRRMATTVWCRLRFDGTITHDRQAFILPDMDLIAIVERMFDIA